MSVMYPDINSFAMYHIIKKNMSLLQTMSTFYTAICVSLSQGKNSPDKTQITETRRLRHNQADVENRLKSNIY